MADGALTKAMRTALGEIVQDISLVHLAPASGGRPLPLSLAAPHHLDTEHFQGGGASHLYPTRLVFASHLEVLVADLGASGRQVSLCSLASCEARVRTTNQEQAAERSIRRLSYNYLHNTGLVWLAGPGGKCGGG
jgi:hypothetical protein